jgi:hypothetical protein
MIYQVKMGKYVVRINKYLASLHKGRMVAGLFTSGAASNEIFPYPLTLCGAQWRH